MLIKDATGAASVAEGGKVCGYASTFDREPDAYGDVVKAGAFADSLKHWEELGKPIPLLYGHNTSDPAYNIGKVTLAKEDERGLYVEAEFDAEGEKAQQVRHLVKEGRLYQFSFAYDVREAGNIKLDNNANAYELQKLDLFEVSLVQIPANQHAEVTDVKGAKYGRRNSKSDEDKIREAISLLSSVLDDEQGDDSDEDEDAKGGEGDVPEGREADEDKAALMALLKSIEKED